MTNKDVTGVSELCNTEVDNRNTRLLQEFLSSSMDALSALAEYLIGAPYGVSQRYFDRTRKQKELVEAILAMAGKAAPAQVVSQSAEATDSTHAPAPLVPQSAGVSASTHTPTHMPAPLVPQSAEDPSSSENVDWDNMFAIVEKKKELSKYLVFNKRNTRGIAKHIGVFSKKMGVPHVRRHVRYGGIGDHHHYPMYFFPMIIEKLEKDKFWMLRYRRNLFGVDNKETVNEG